MNAGFGNPVLLNIFFNFVFVVTVIAECFKNLGKCKMRHTDHHFFRGKSELPVLNNGPNRGSCIADNRLSAKDFIVPDNIFIIGYRNHNEILTNTLFFVKESVEGSGLCPAPAGTLSHCRRVADS